MEHLRKVGSDFKKLLTQWKEYYSLPFEWGYTAWLMVAVFISSIVISANFDEPIRYFCFGLHTRFGDIADKFAHWFGTGWPTLYLFLGLYCGGLIWKSTRARLGGLMILQSYLYSGAITISLKSIIGRWRPAAGHGHLQFSPFILGPNAHLSFPSGDVAVVVSLATIMSGLSKNLVWKILWIVLAIVTSFSRMYYDAHWFSDVIFSMVNAAAASLWVLKRNNQDVSF